MFIRLFLIFTLLVISTPAWADTHPASTCSNADIQTAIDAASDGDTVTIPAGDCTWTGDVTVDNTKGIIIQGNGALDGTGTDITNGGNQLFFQTTTGNSLLRFTGVNVTISSGTFLIITGTAQAGWRIDNNKFQWTNDNAGHAIKVGNGSGVDSYTWGLIDNNTMTDFPANSGQAMFFEWPRGAILDGAISPSAPGNWVWQQPYVRGSDKAIFIEDNTFTNNASEGAFVWQMEVRWGARVVVRNNTGHNMQWSTHSGCTNSGRQPQWTEFYNNNTTSDTGRPARYLFFRGASGIVWSNEAGSNYTNFGSYNVDYEQAYRTNCGGGPILWNEQCDGDRTIDQNTGNVSTTPYGYICHGQPGWGGVQDLDLDEIEFAGVFFWDNLRGGSAQEGFRVNDDATYQATYLQYGREIFRDGAGEIVTGVIASRPGTCDPGPAGRDVYVSTDENSQGAVLYICSATDTWTEHWRPYTYPHPLQGGADTTNPVVTITTPTTDPTFATGVTPVTVAGTCTDNVAVLSVTWNNDVGGSGTATGLDNWSQTIDLASGANVITITCTDTSSNTHNDVITVTYTPPPVPAPTGILPTIGGIRVIAQNGEQLHWDGYISTAGPVGWFEVSTNGGAYLSWDMVTTIPLLVGVTFYSIRPCNSGGCAVPIEVEVEVLPDPPSPIDPSHFRVGP